MSRKPHTLTVLSMTHISKLRGLFYSFTRYDFLWSILRCLLPTATSMCVLISSLLSTLLTWRISYKRGIKVNKGMFSWCIKAVFPPKVSPESPRRSSNVRWRKRERRRMGLCLIFFCFPPNLSVCLSGHPPPRHLCLMAFMKIS